MFWVDEHTGYVIYTHLTNGDSQWVGNLIYIPMFSFGDDALSYQIVSFTNTRNAKAKQPSLVPLNRSSHSSAVPQAHKLRFLESFSFESSTIVPETVQVIPGSLDAPGVLYCAT